MSDATQHPGRVRTFVYERCVPHGRTTLRRAHRAWFRSPATARVLFSTRLAGHKPPTYRYDLTTVLLARHLAPRVKARPTMQMLELGVGPSALPSAYLARFADVPIDAVDIDPDSVSSARAVADANDRDVRIWRSDLFSEVANDAYDLIWWNLPYYEHPRFLEPLFADAPAHLAAGGDLVLGYNSVALPRPRILEILGDNDGLRVAAVRQWSWNLHELLELRRP